MRKATLSTLFGLLLPLAAALSLAAGFAPGEAQAKSRIKDIVSFEGVRENELIGQGLVVGLNGTGDSLRNVPMTKQGLQSMMERLGINTRDANIDTKNVAVVMVTARLPAFAAAGSTIDVSVSSAGDAKSLLGGTLLTTPLMGATGEVYAVAQGTVQTGAVSAGGASGSSVTRGVPTSGRIAGGAEIEKEVDFKLASLENMRLTLRNPDFTTALRVAEVINRAYPGTASAENGTIVTLRLPKDGAFVTFLSSIEQLEVEPDTLAKVIINEVDGVVVMTSDVRVSTVAIAQGNLTITINERPQVSQPAPFSQGQTTVTPQSTVKVDEEKGKKFITLNSGTSLAVLVKGLNALGVSPRDMISILQSIKTAGALQADIEVQ
jgi:flagellar P-ring protein precursor FlgI